MISGIGIDLVEKMRVARAIERHGERFLARVLTAGERANMHGSATAFVSGRIAAKEALMKALGTGWAQGVSWRHIEVRNLASGAPRMFLNGVARERLRARSGWTVHVTLTDTRDHALAMVVIEAGDSGCPTRRPLAGDIG